MLNDSPRKPSKIWVGKASEFNNSFLKKLLKDNDIKMCSRHNAGKSFLTEKFIRTLKSRISCIKRCVY